MESALIALASILGGLLITLLIWITRNLWQISLDLRSTSDAVARNAILIDKLIDRIDRHDAWHMIQGDRVRIARKNGNGDDDADN